MSRNCAHSVEVALPLPVQTAYTYRVPEDMRGDIELGKRVLVPLGSRRMTGYVVGFPDTNQDRELKSVLAVLDDEPLFGERDLELYRWASSYYLYPLGLTIQTALPAGLNEKYQALYALSETGRQELRSATGRTQRVLAALADGEFESAGASKKNRMFAAPAPLCRIFSGAAVLRRRFISAAARLLPVWRTWYSALADASAEGLRGRQLEVYQWIAGAGCIAYSVLRERHTTCSVQLKALQAKNLITASSARCIVSQRSMPRSCMSRCICLNDEQRAATEAMRAVLDERRYQAFLLHGVTGSGKTEVYLQLMQHVLERGQQCLFMVPEISLTVQLRDRISSRLASPVAMLHSSLSAAERFDAWRAIRRGDIKIIIGARSAVFAACADLGFDHC